MLSKLVVEIYSALLELGLWILLAAGAVGGWRAASDEGTAAAVFGALAGFLTAAVLGAVFFGAFLVLNDIRARVKEIESRCSSRST